MTMSGKEKSICNSQINDLYSADLLVAEILCQICCTHIFYCSEIQY